MATWRECPGKGPACLMLFVPPEPEQVCCSRTCARLYDVMRHGIIPTPADQKERFMSAVSAAFDQHFPKSGKD